MKALAILILALLLYPGSGMVQASERREQIELRRELQKECYDRVQNKIAWNYKGSKKWSPKNINRLCAGARTSPEPARCFQRVMHGGINWGGGTKWKWENAINLCEGTTNHRTTIGCFQRKIQQGKPWSTAIRACDSR